MRLWSLHPSYLDARGLVALWREGLLARTVLCGETKGYRRHPQLARFRAQHDPLAAMDCYLHHVREEAVRRGYRFDGRKIGAAAQVPLIPVTAGQIAFELAHLKRKLVVRNGRQFGLLAALDVPEPHPLFIVVAGEIESWEKVGQS